MTCDRCSHDRLLGERPRTGHQLPPGIVKRQAGKADLQKSYVTGLRKLSSAVAQKQNRDIDQQGQRPDE